MMGLNSDAQGKSWDVVPAVEGCGLEEGVKKGFCVSDDDYRYNDVGWEAGTGAADGHNKVAGGGSAQLPLRCY